MPWESPNSCVPYHIDTHWPTAHNRAAGAVRRPIPRGRSAQRCRAGIRHWRLQLRRVPADYSTLAGVLVALGVLAMAVGLFRSETAGDLRWGCGVMACCCVSRDAVVRLAQVMVSSGDSASAMASWVVRFLPVCHASVHAWWLR